MTRPAKQVTRQTRERRVRDELDCVARHTLHVLEGGHPGALHNTIAAIERLTLRLNELAAVTREAGR
jgi:hypothetical protein